LTTQQLQHNEIPWIMFGNNRIFWGTCQGLAGKNGLREKKEAHVDQKEGGDNFDE
jgi:hypothetical protein